MGCVKVAVGDRFGRLVIQKRLENNSHGSSYWECLCDCGNTTIVEGSSLFSGATRSCKCLFRESIKNRPHFHFMRGTREYMRWRGMIMRCASTSGSNFKNYASRGIRVCKEWQHDFRRFLADMGPCPLGMTLERKDNNLGYSPENCRWATDAEQRRNTRRNHYIEHNGERKLLCDWATELGVQPSSILQAINAGRTLGQYIANSRLHRSWRGIS